MTHGTSMMVKATGTCERRRETRNTETTKQVRWAATRLRVSRSYTEGQDHDAYNY